MGKKPQRHSWPEAKKLCRFNQNDIEMARRFNFGPDALIRSRPDPKQKWKLPVNLWVRELYLKRFGQVLGEKRFPAPLPVEFDEDEMRRIEEQFYWEDYFARNEEPPPKKCKGKTTAPASTPGSGAVPHQVES
jgi:hypothetical protein